MKYLDHNPKKVALVCMGPSCTDYMQYVLTQEFNPYWVDEVWAINMAANAFRFDVCFWMDDLEQQKQFRPMLMEALRQFNKPVITSKRYPKIVPKSFDFPIQEVGSLALKEFGMPYLNNGVAMAVAYAIWKKVETLFLYGADFTYPNRDYAESGRACVEMWLGLACARGMKLGLPPGT